SRTHSCCADCATDDLDLVCSTSFGFRFDALRARITSADVIPRPAVTSRTPALTLFRVSLFFFSSRRRHTRFSRDWSSDVCSSDLGLAHRGKKVLLIDIDSQANSSKVLIDDYQKLNANESVYSTIIERQSLPVR